MIGMCKEINIEVLEVEEASISKVVSLGNSIKMKCQDLLSMAK